MQLLIWLTISDKVFPKERLIIWFHICTLRPFYIGAFMPIEKFKTDVWTTAGARFNAHRRLRNKQNASIFCISLLSLFNISIVIFEILPTKYNDNASLLFSVFIIMVSLLEFSKDYATKGERLHVNAMAINDFNKNLTLHQNLDQALLDEYQRIKNSCAENHEPYDMELFRIQHRKIFYNEDSDYSFWWRISSVRTNNIVRTYLIYGILLTCAVRIFFFQ